MIPVSYIEYVDNIGRYVILDEEGFLIDPLDWGGVLLLSKERSRQTLSLMRNTGYSSKLFAIST